MTGQRVLRRSDGEAARGTRVFGGLRKYENIGTFNWLLIYDGSTENCSAGVPPGLPTVASSCEEQLRKNGSWNLATGLPATHLEFSQACHTASAEQRSVTALTDLSVANRQLLDVLLI